MRRITINMFAALCAVTAASAASAQDLDRLYCAERALGVFFYCEPSSDAPEETPPHDAEAASVGARGEAARIREQMEEARAEAVLRPTPENVAAYIALQREQLDRATLFADVWRRLLWERPDLDYTLVRPVGQLAKQVWLDERSAARNDAVEAISDRYGLFYFFSSSCGACKTFSPILRAFADAHGLTVRAVSVDGGRSLYFPAATHDRGQMERMGLADAPTPAVVLFDAAANAVRPVAFGIVSADDLAERIYLLTASEVGDDL